LEVSLLFKRSKLAPLTAGKIDNLLGSNTSFNGTIKSDGNIRLDGIYQGRIETAGNVIVGPSARVLADIVANTVQVWGAVRGDITAKGRLEILPDGRVWGNVQVVSLLIDEGGMFLGQCQMAGEQVEPLTLPEPAPAESGELNEEAESAGESETDTPPT
jgi:cytoskeletal protein CcmA (bactofilin family)